MNEDLLSGYLDDELTPTERAAVEDELARSPEWRAVLDELRGTRTLLRTLPWPDAPADLIAGMRPRDDLADWREVKERARWRRPLAWVAAAAAAAAILGVVVVPRPDSSEPDVPALADAHAARSSLDVDPIGALATMGVVMEPSR